MEVDKVGARENSETASKSLAYNKLLKTHTLLDFFSRRPVPGLQVLYVFTLLHRGRVGDKGYRRSQTGKCHSQNWGAIRRSEQLFAKPEVYLPVSSYSPAKGLSQTETRYHRAVKSYPGSFHSSIHWNISVGGPAQHLFTSTSEIHLHSLALVEAVHMLNEIWQRTMERPSWG